MSLTQLTLVCSRGQEVSGLNPHLSIYYNTFAKKKKKKMNANKKNIKLVNFILKNGKTIFKLDEGNFTLGSYKTCA